MPRAVPVVIFGAGGHGRDFVGVIDALNAREPAFDLLGFVDDGVVDEDAVRRLGSRMLGDRSALADVDAEILLGVAYPQIRRTIAHEVGTDGDAPTLVHPQSTVCADTTFGPGCVISAGARLSTNVRLGCQVHVNWNATIGHDARIGDFVTVTPGVHIAGGVTIEEGVFFGTASAVIPGVHIGADAVIGAGAIVVDDVKPGTTVAGVPARLLGR